MLPPKLQLFYTIILYVGAVLASGVRHFDCAPVYANEDDAHSYCTLFTAYCILYTA
jgi:hypothetical protein